MPIFFYVAKIALDMQEKGMSSVERVRETLLASDHPDTITSFPESTRTAADAAAAIGCTVAQIAKSIVFRSGEKPVVVIASGVNRVDPAKVAAALGTAVESAEGRWVRDVTGFAIGGVAPVGHQTEVLIVVDEDLLALDPVWAAAGSPTHVFKTTVQDLIRLTGAKTANIKQG